MDYPKEIKDLIEDFSLLPSIGKKSAERLALYIFQTMNQDNVNHFASSLLNVKNNLHICPHCGNVTSDDLCLICQDEKRNKKLVMVVENIKDVFMMEKMGGFNGVYHVLGGAINLASGVGIEDINVNSLIKRVDEENIEEIILATNATTEGETTARYIKILLEDKNVLLTRIAYGIPFGGDISFADQMTLLKAIEGRRNY